MGRRLGGEGREWGGDGGRGDGSDRVGSGRIGSDRVGLGRLGSDRVGLGRIGSGGGSRKTPLGGALVGSLLPVKTHRPWCRPSIPVVIIRGGFPGGGRCLDPSSRSKLAKVPAAHAGRNYSGEISIPWSRSVFAIGFLLPVKTGPGLGRPFRSKLFHWNPLEQGAFPVPPPGQNRPRSPPSIPVVILPVGFPGAGRCSGPSSRSKPAQVSPVHSGCNYSGEISWSRAVFGSPPLLVKTGPGVGRPFRS